MELIRAGGTKTTHPKGPFTDLTASHGVMRCSADRDRSTQLNSGIHMPHHVHVDGINGTPAADM